MINAFYDRVEQDELLSPFFPGGVHADHRRNVATWWSEVFGGPAEYSEQLGGYERMLEKHRGLGITDEQRLRFATLMSLAADDARDAQRSRIPFRARCLPGMGHTPRPRELANRCRGDRSTRRYRAGVGVRLRLTNPDPADPLMVRRGRGG